jgi:colanic acid/amylovoran biosynthesis glycosyltransferase
MKKVAYILGRFPVLSETFIGDEIRALEAAGCEVLPIALHRPDAPFQPQDAPLAERTRYFCEILPEQSKQLLRLYRWRLWRALPFVWRQTTEPRYPLLVHAADIAHHVEAHGCRHIHAHFGWGAATYAIAAAKLANIPVSFTCHGSDVYARPMDLLLKCRSASHIIGVAPTISQDLQRLAPRRRSHLVYCGVDTAQFHPLEEHQTPHDKWLFVGRLISCKGVEDILHAWSLLPPDGRPTLDIIGDGPLRQDLEAQAKARGIAKQVNFLGEQTSGWLHKHGPHYHAMITAFRTTAEGSDTAPMVLKEAMAMGLPLVTTRHVDIPEVVGDEAALFAPPNAPEALAEAVQRMLRLPATQRKQMAQAGRQRAEALFSSQQQAEKLLRIFGLKSD